MCGDYNLGSLSSIKVIGSPLHVRGLQDQAQGNSLYFGITPACAGTTVFLLSSSLAWEDHPRLCGDYDAGPITIRSFKGSPLHMRGLLFSIKSYFSSPRITPAYAGTT